MAKTIIPHRAIVEFNDNGTFKDCILQYRLQDANGKLDVKYYSISVSSQISKPVMNGILSAIKTFVTNQENP